ncbi:hypothetical protein [Paremcibacter congregatus]|uniref:hypothetical protein n=1 Tax=Paremcibacter congregatus TaxID=2043170 RepID=UPI003A8EE20D
MKLYPTKFTPETLEITELFELIGTDVSQNASANLNVGVAGFQNGVRHPLEGMAAHDQEEISIILEGEFLLETPAGKSKCRAGDVVHIAAGEEHASTAFDNGRVFYVLFG